MPRAPHTRHCPCGSGASFAHCCQPLLEGRQAAASAVVLMRSRYCAFALGYFEYLIDTLHPEYRGDLGVAQLAEQDRHCRWLTLRVLGQRDGEPGDGAGTVHFIARYLEAGTVHELEENSGFAYHQGRWVYTLGTPEFRALGKPRRNDPCPCGSGKKFKQCHPL